MFCHKIDQKVEIQIESELEPLIKSMPTYPKNKKEERVYLKSDQ